METNDCNIGWEKCPKDKLENYLQKCTLFSNNDEFFKNFRRDSDYEVITGDGGEILGKMYIENIKEKNEFGFLLDNISLFKENDLIGNPRIFEYEKIGKISGATLRYVSNLINIKSLLGNYKPKKIVEVGAGYGGLCKIISTIYCFDEYVIIDLPQVISFCKKYIEKFDVLKNKIRFISSDDDVKEENIDLFISDAAFSELSIEYQNKYINNFIKNSQYSYVSFNTCHILKSKGECQNFSDILQETNSINTFIENDGRLIYNLKKI